MFTYMSGILSTIERVFGLRSEYSAYVMSGNEISQFLLIFFVPCITRIKRRPLWVGLGMMLSVLGCFFISLASFTTSKTSHHWVRNRQGPEKNQSFQNDQQSLVYILGTNIRTFY